MIDSKDSPSPYLVLLYAVTLFIGESEGADQSLLDTELPCRSCVMFFPRFMTVFVRAEAILYFRFPSCLHKSNIYFSCSNLFS